MHESRRSHDPPRLKNVSKAVDGHPHSHDKVRTPISTRAAPPGIGAIVCTPWTMKNASPKKADSPKSGSPEPTRLPAPTPKVGFAKSISNTVTSLFGRGHNQPKAVKKGKHTEIADQIEEACRASSSSTSTSYSIKSAPPKQCTAGVSGRLYGWLLGRTCQAPSRSSLTVKNRPNDSDKRLDVNAATHPAAPPMTAHSAPAPPVTPILMKTAAIREDATRFYVEYFKSPKDPLMFGEEQNLGMRHGVLIHNCENVEIFIQKKCNKVEIDNCKRVIVHLPAVISAVDVSNCDACTVKVQTSVPGISIDTCQSLQFYIPRNSMEGLEISSSGGGTANLLLPTEDDPDDFIEIPIPFNFVHRFDGEKLKSEPSPLYSH